MKLSPKDFFFLFFMFKRKIILDVHTTFAFNDQNVDQFVCQNRPIKYSMLKVLWRPLLFSLFVLVFCILLHENIHSKQNINELSHSLSNWHTQNKNNCIFPFIPMNAHNWEKVHLFNMKKYRYDHLKPKRTKSRIMLQCQWQ